MTEIIIGEAISVHRELGPGLLESAYETCLWSALTSRGLQVQRQFGLPIRFREVSLHTGYRVDLMVENLVIVELKTVAKIETVHMAQVVTYLRFSGCHVGLILNFNVHRMLDGIRRIVR
ncbi:MAG TPA: GxxExxY protein [Longimicrobiales bacterium]